MRWIFLPLFLTIVHPSKAQDSISKKVIDVPQKYLSEVKRRSDKLSCRITGSSTKLLRQCQKEEEKLKIKGERLLTLVQMYTVFGTQDKAFQLPLVLILENGDYSGLFGGRLGFLEMPL